MSARGALYGLLRLLRAAGAAVLLIALLVGIPAALWALQGSPLPDHVPTLDEVTTLLTQQDDGSALLKVLSWFGWAGWLTFAVSVVVELAGQLRGRTAPQLPAGFGAQQKLASILIAAIVTAVPGGTAFAATSSATIHEPVKGGATVSAERVAGPGVAQQAAPSPHVRDAAPTVRYEVQPGDTLGSIAQEQLGDFSQWRVIAKLNMGSKQPDGRALTDSHWVYPGWVLELPAGAATSAGAPSADQHTHVVRTGETLSEIAEQKLGDPGRFPELVEATGDLRQPGGQVLTDPDLIRPGWTIVVPGAEAAPTQSGGETGTRHPATAEPAPPAAAERPTTPRTEAAPEPARPDAPAATPRADSELEPQAPGSGVTGGGDAVAGSGREVRPAPAADPLQPAERAVQQGPAAAAGDASEVDHVDERLVLETGLGIGGVLAAGLLMAYAGKRTRRLRARRAGRRVPAPVELSDVELEVRVSETPQAAQLLNLAVRTLAHALSTNGTPAPALRGARLTQHGLELHLAAPRPTPPAPFQLGDSTDVWVLSNERADQLLDPHEAAEVPAPYPTLVTVGKDDTGAVVLLDLESVSALTLLGPVVSAEEVLSAIALELGVSDYADDLRVYLVGWGEDVARTIASTVKADRMSAVEDLDMLLDDLEEHVRDVQSLLEQDDAGDVATARATGRASEAWTPIVVLSAIAPTPDQRARLSDLVPAVPRLSLAVAVSVDDASRALPSSMHLQAAHARTRIELLGIDVELQRVPREQCQRLLSWLAPAHETDVEELGADDATSDLPLQVHELPEPAPTSQQVADEVLVIDLRDSAPAAALSEDGEPAQDAPVLALDPHAPEVLILGPTAVAGARGELPEMNKRIGTCTALAVYMALFPGRGRSSVARDVWGTDEQSNTANRNSTVQRLRRWLGKNDQGDYYLPKVTGQDRYELHESVRCDWTRFKHLAERGRVNHSRTDLEAALALVRGRPFEGTDLLLAPHRARWAEPIEMEALQLIADVAHLVALHRLRDGDAAGATAAIAVGLNVNPHDQTLRADRIEIADHTDNHEGVEKAIRDFYDWLGEDVPAKETLNLLERVRKHRHQAV